MEKEEEKEGRLSKEGEGSEIDARKRMDGERREE